MSYFRQYLLVLMFSLFVTSLHANEKECFEKASRAVFKFNQTLDNVLIGPLAKGYNKLPEPIRKGTGNFTSNIARLLSIPNHLLQGNVSEAGHSLGSFAINTTIGILGLIDVADDLGLDQKEEDWNLITNDKFTLSEFQKWAMWGIIHGHHVLITAHTGSGKTYTTTNILRELLNHLL